MPFFTRPNFEDRQQVQYEGTSITLSGNTNINQTGQLIILGPILDFTGTTTASTLYTLAGTSGYINYGNVSGLKIEPPLVLISGSTGTTTVDVTGYYLGSIDSEGNVIWVPPFTGTTSGSCLSDICIKGLLSTVNDMIVNSIKIGRGETGWVSNTVVGKDSLSVNTTGQYLTAMGKESLMSNTTGDYNSAFGYRSLRDNTLGSNNVAIGSDSLLTNNSSDNIAIGVETLSNNIVGTTNIGIGTQSLLNNDGDYNTAIGTLSLYTNTNGDDNNAFGYSSLVSNTVGSYNVAIGNYSLVLNTNGDGNVAIGMNAGYNNISGTDNTFIGNGSDCAVTNLINATAIGAATLLSQNNTVILGNGADVGIGTSLPTSKLDVYSINGYEQLRLRTPYTPSGTTDVNGDIGNFSWDDNFIYIKTSAGWKRSGLTTF
jgi:hypothetical protein